ncbi:cytochrome protein [Alcanivorax sp. 521-1]|uniref:Cytochrome protein n=1 Tax=Alloalcanivorax profundimaris TaxID=2735259 RepID=A0ABS0ASZ8_9GAMM|nr:cytochrome protein [Alloalcanivorax profundimaris]
MANALYDATGVRFRSPPFSPARVRASLQARRDRGKRRWWWAGALAVTGLLATLWPWRASLAPVSRPATNLYSAETIERGRLVAEAGDCAVCHTAEEGLTNVGGRPFETPFGTLYSTNLTPDPDTGIGNWSYAAFERAMREGISRDGRHLYPAFPYTDFAKLSNADMQALYAYLMAQPAVAAPAPDNDLRFPFNVRSMMAGWNTLFHRDRTFQPDPARSPQWNRGAYLFEGAGHCGACHTPRNLFGAEKTGQARLAGALVDGWEAPALTADSRAPVAWTEESLFQYLRTGRSDFHGVAGGPMAPVVAGLAELPESDVRAIAHYVATQMDAPASATEAQQRQARERLAASAEPVGQEAGQRVFDGACASCHADGAAASFTGARQSLALNTNLHSERPDNVIQSILGGVHVEGVAGGGEMPAFSHSLSNRQVSDLVHYLRARFAPGETPWKDVGRTVAEIRREHNQQP